jgi:hypothetical protein
MQLLAFLLYNRITAYFSIRYNWKGLVMDALLAALFLFYGLALAMLYDYSLHHQAPGLPEPIHLLSGMALSVLIAPILLRLFPGFGLKTILVSPHYPQTKLLIATLDLIAMGMCKTRNAIYLLFLLAFYSFSHGLPSGTPATLILLLGIGIVMAESLVNALSWRVYFHTLILAILFVVLLWSIRNYYGSVPMELNLGLIATLIVLICLYFLFYKTEMDETRSSPLSTARSGTSRRSRSPYLRILAGNKPFLIVLGVGLFFKLLIMAVFVFSKGYTLDEALSRAPFVLCLIMPVILFSYVYNNFWGYFYTIAINNLITGNDAARQIRLYLYFLTPAFLLDAGFTAAILLMRHMLEGKIILCYLAMTALCIPVGIISSFRKYFFVPGIFDFRQMRGKTSRFYTFSLLIPALLLGFLYTEDRLFAAAIAVITITAITLFVYIHHNKQSLLSKLKGDFFS